MMTNTVAKTTFRYMMSSVIALAVAGPGTASACIVTGAGPGGLPMVHSYQFIHGSPTLNFNALGPGFTGGVRVAAGRISGIAAGDVITASGPGGAPQLNIYHGVTGALINSFLAYSVSYTGGVFVAGGDITGDGISDVITGTDAGAGPNVKVFNATTGAVLRSFFAFEPGFLGGARVAAGDVNADGLDDIIVGRGPGGSPEVRVFDGGTGLQIRSFLALPAGFTGGIFVAGGDVNGDGHAEIIVSADAGALPQVKVFDGITNSLLIGYDAFAANFTGGVRVAAADLTSDGRAEIIACQGAGGTGEIRVFHGLSGALLGSKHVLGQAFAQGMWIAANPRGPICRADIAPLAGGDGLVNITDLLMAISAWGACVNPLSCPADIAAVGPNLSGDGEVNVDDLLAVIYAWGACP